MRLVLTLPAGAEQALRLGLLFGLGLIIALWKHNSTELMEREHIPPWETALLALGLAWCMLSFSGISTFLYSNF